jgi:hypothetical protein
LADLGRRDAALAPIEEAVTHYRQLAERNPDAWLPDLATSLNNLSGRLAEVRQADRADATWREVLDAFDGPYHAVLAVARGAGLVRLGRMQDAALLLMAVATSTVDGAATASARQALRGLRDQTPDQVDQWWTDQTGKPTPAWLLLPTTHIRAVIGWLNTPTWPSSHDHLTAHAGTLLGADTDTALDELALDQNPALIDQHRAILAAARQGGIDTAYRPLLLHDLIGAWLDTPDWDTSRTFIDDHPDLLTDEAAELVDQLIGQRATAALALHHALLTLIQHDGTVTSYQYLTDRTAVDHGLDRALTAPSHPALRALAIIELVVYNQPFLALAHQHLAAILAGATDPVPDELASPTEGVDLADRHRVAAQIAQLMPHLPKQITALAALQRAVLATG